MQVPDRWWERHAEKPIALRGSQPDREKPAALAMCENLDWNVGRLLAAIDDDVLIAVQSNFGATFGVATPEPSTAALLALTAVGLALSRR